MFKEKSLDHFYNFENFQLDNIYMSVCVPENIGNLIYDFCDI